MRTITPRSGPPEDCVFGAFEERLLTELKFVVAEQAAAIPEPARPSRSAFPARLRRTGVGVRASRAGTGPPRPRARAALAGALTVALAAGLAIATVAHPGARKPASPQYSLVADFLNRAAAAARAQSSPPPHAGQLFYVELFMQTPYPPDHQCLVMWFSPDGKPAGNTFRTYSPGGHPCGNGTPAPPNRVYLMPGLGAYYPDPSSLPTDPGALLARLDQDASRDGQKYESISGPSSRNDIVFDLITRLLQGPIPGALRAALYEASARVPGVVLVPHVADLLGRHGTAISRKQSYAPGAPMGGFILDTTTYRFLGTTAIGPPARGTHGETTVVVPTAVLRTGIVNAPHAVIVNTPGS